MASTLVLTYFGRPRLGQAIETNCVTFQIDDPEIWSIIKGSGASFFITSSVQFFKKYFSRNFQLTNQIPLSGCLYFLRYRVICIFYLFISQSMRSQTSKLIAFQLDQKGQEKKLNTLRTKRAIKFI